MVATILWGEWQLEHITRRHGVSSAEFGVAWHDPGREDLAEEMHGKHGPYTISVGAAMGYALTMVWRWQGQDEVWPITAYRTAELEDRPRRRQSGQKQRRKTARKKRDT